MMSANKEAMKKQEIRRPMGSSDSSHRTVAGIEIANCERKENVE